MGAGRPHHLIARPIPAVDPRRPRSALAIVDGLAPELAGEHLFHAIRADLLRRLDRNDEAAAAYAAAISRTDNAAERTFLRHRREALSPR